MKISSNKNRKSITKNVFAENIAKLMIKKQRLFANYLNRKADGFSINTIKFILIGFCIAFGGYSAYLILWAIKY